MLAQDDKQRVRYYAISTQKISEQEDYYSILEMTQKESYDVTGWLVWFLGCFAWAIKHSDDMLNGLFSKAGFWQTHAQDKPTDRQKKVINRLLDAGAGGFEGGLTTRKFASMTHCSPSRRIGSWTGCMHNRDNGTYRSRLGNTICIAGS
jgi:Fic family protein